MRAVVYDRYGPPDVLRLEEVERPVPNADEVLVKIHATTVNRTDCGWRSAKPFLTRYFLGLLRPKRKILGMELAGEVEAVGAAVTEFAVGDHVFGSSGFRFGAHAEFICVRESARIAHKPTGMSFEEAATVCDGGLNALWRVRGHRHRRGAARQVLRSRRHCGVQHEEPRDREIARSRQSDRLHAGRLHQERPNIRRHLRCSRQALVRAVQRLT